MWLDVTLGSWKEFDSDDHVTFSVRVDVNGAGVVDAPVAVEGKADYFGQKLGREQALSNERITEVWDLVDFLVTADPTVKRHVYR